MTQRSGTGSSHSEELLSALVSRPMGFLVISILFPASFTGASFDSRSVSLKTGFLDTEPGNSWGTVRSANAHTGPGA